MTCYRGFLLGSCRRVAGGRVALRGPGAGGPAGRRHLGHGQPRELAGCGSRPDGGFRPSRVVVVAKTTRYEFEQQRYRYAELSEEDLKQLVGPGAPAVLSWPGPWRLCPLDQVPIEEVQAAPRPPACVSLPPLPPALTVGPGRAGVSGGGQCERRDARIPPSRVARGRGC